jgi:AcrR family transcriptional regulator
MPRKQLYTREVIIEAAFSITRQSGWQAVSARSIAQELSASTQPIYSYIKAMGKLSDEVRLRAILLLAEFQAKSYTENPYVNMAIGYISFAREEQNLFRFIFLDNSSRPLLPEENTAMNEAITHHLGKPLPMQTWFGKIPLTGFNDIALKTWFFTHGLAVALCTGTMMPISDDKIRKLLEETGEAIFLWQTNNYKLETKDT